MPSRPHTHRTHDRPADAVKGPAEHRWDAAYNGARQTGDLLTLELLDEAW